MLVVFSRSSRQTVEYDLGQERPVEHLVAIEEVAVEDEFEAIDQVAAGRLACELEVEDVGERADPVCGLLLEAGDCFDVDFGMVRFVEEVEDAVAEAAERDFAEVVVPYYLALALEAVGRGGVEGRIG